MEHGSTRTSGAGCRLRRIWRSCHGMRTRLFIVYTHIFIFNIHHVFRDSYRRKYNLPPRMGPTPLQEPHKPPITSSIPRKDDQLVNRKRHRPHHRHQDEPAWHWRNLPKLPDFFMYYRVINSIYFVYICIKYLTPDLLQMLLDKLELTKPIFCYAPGNFVIHEQVNRLCAVAIACFHLVWRLFTIFDFRPLEITTFYFLILDDRDIELYHNIINEQRRYTMIEYYYHPYPSRDSAIIRSPKRSPTACDKGFAHYPDDPQTPASLHLAMMHDIMSYRIERVSGVTYKLRPNRTAAACKDMRNFAILVTIISSALFLILASTITLVLIVIIIDDRTYLKQYPSCDPELEMEFHRGQLSYDKWSYQLTQAKLVSVLFDALENLFLYLESGMVLYSCIVCTLILNHDLTTHWSHINCKIEGLLMLLQEDIHDQSRFGWSPHSRSADAHDELVYQLQMEIRDFMMHLRRSDLLLGDVMTTVVSVWFVLFAYLVYSVVTHEGNIPTALVLLLVCIFFCTTFQSMMTISVHSKCTKSYSKICSLMAMDTSRYKEHFIEVLDFFTRKRTCYNIYRAVPMTNTRYLTLIGYSFSVFFVLCSTSTRIR